MARSTLTSLIDQLRTLTQAPTDAWTLVGSDGTLTYWSDDQCQEILDRHRLDLDGEPLTILPHAIGGGTLTWQDYRSRYDWLEATDGGTAVFVLRDSAGSVAGTALWTADYGRGILTFGTSTGGTSYYLWARSYDLYGAAAELLRAWAAREKLSYDVDSDGQRLTRSQKARNLLDLAREYSRQARPQTIRTIRTDLAGVEEGGLP